MSSFVSGSFACDYICEFIHNVAFLHDLLFLVALPHFLLCIYHNVPILLVMYTGLVSTDHV